MGVTSTIIYALQPSNATCLSVYVAHSALSYTSPGALASAASSSALSVDCVTGLSYVLMKSNIVTSLASANAICAG